MDLTRPLLLSNKAVMLLWAGNRNDGLEERGKKCMCWDDRRERYFDDAALAFSASLQEIKKLISYTTDNSRINMAGVGAIPEEQSPSPSVFSPFSGHDDDNLSSAPSLDHDGNKQKCISFSFQTFSEICDKSDKSCYVYNKAILFHFGDGEESSSSKFRTGTHPSCLSRKDLLHFYSSFIMLNIALAYHQKALSLPLGNLQDMAFGQAEQMYELVAQKLYSNMGFINESLSTELGITAFLVSAAAINNLSQLQYRRCEYTESLKGFEFLGSLIFHAVIDEADSSFLKTRILNEEDENVYRHMLLNVYFLYPPTLAAAA